MEAAKTAREKEGGKEKKEPGKKKEKEKEKEEDKEGLRGGTGAAGPLFQLPGDKKSE